MRNMDLSSSRAHTALALHLVPGLQSASFLAFGQTKPCSHNPTAVAGTTITPNPFTPPRTPLVLKSDCLCLSLTAWLSLTACASDCLSLEIHTCITILRYVLEIHLSPQPPDLYTCSQLIWFSFAVHHTLSCTPTLTPVTATQACKANKKSNTCMKVFV